MTAGTAWNAGLRPAQPAEGGRREGLPVPGWSLVGGSLSVRRDPYLGVADAVCHSAGHVPAFHEGGRQGTARDPGVVVSGPTGRNAHDRSVCTPIPEKMPRHSRWLGTASSVLVSRSRACRPEAGVPSRSCRCAVGPTPSHLLGGTCRDGSHPGDWGLRRRGPAGRCAGRRPALQAVPAMAPSG